MKWRLNENSKIIVPGSVTDYWYLFNGRSFEAISPAVNGANLEFTVSENKTAISLIRTNFDVLNPADADEQRKAEQIRANLTISSNINAHRVNEGDSSLGVIEHYDARGGKQVVSDYSGVHIYVPRENDEIGMYFDGVDDYILLGDIDTLEGFDALTLQTKIYIHSLPSGLGVPISFAKENIYKIALLSNGSIRFLTGNDWSGAALDSTDTSTTGQIYDIAGTYDGSTKRLYINAILNNTLSTTGNTGSNTYPVTVAGTDKGNGYLRGLHGIVYYTLLYDRALSLNEIQQNMRGQIVQDGLKAYYDFTKKLTLSNGKIPDLSGNGNHGTINGAKWVNYAELEEVKIG